MFFSDWLFFRFHGTFFMWRFFLLNFSASEKFFVCGSLHHFSAKI